MYLFRVPLQRVPVTRAQTRARLLSKYGISPPVQLTNDVPEPLTNYLDVSIYNNDIRKFQYILHFVLN